MAINYTDNGDGTATIEISYTTGKAKIDDTIMDAAQYYYAHGYGQEYNEDGEKIAWADLPNGKRLAVIDDWCKRAIITAAGSLHVTSAADEARAAAREELADKYLSA